MALSGIKGASVAAMATGGLFVWSGVKGWNLTATLGEVIAGQKPSGSEVYPLSSGSSSSGGTGSPGSATSSSIANTALQYKGHCYIYGGSPGTNGTGCWDCSSFCNYVIGAKLGGAIPGFKAGTYNGNGHGPPTGSWGIWPGLQKISLAQMQAGDIIVWTGHMGIAISNTQMISALDPTDGTTITTVNQNGNLVGGNGPLMKIGRYVG